MYRRSYLILLPDGTEEWFTLSFPAYPSVTDICAAVGHGMGITILDDRDAPSFHMSAAEASTPLDTTR